MTLPATLAFDAVDGVRTCPADALVPRVLPERFVSGRDCHVVAAPSLMVQLRRPVVVNPPPGGLSIQRPDGMPPQPPGLLSQVTCPDMTLSRLSDALCVPGGVALSASGDMLLESFAARWDTAVHHHVRGTGEGRFRLRRPLGTVLRLPGQHLLLDYQHIAHYGHFLLDVLSRVWAFHHARDCYGLHDLRVLVSGIDQAPFVLPLLQGAGVPLSRVTVIEQAVRCEELFVATKAFQIQEYASPLAAATWRRIGRTLERGRGGPQRVYLSRSRVRQRPCLAEPAVEELFARRGFVVVHAQELDAAVQVDLLANARLVAGTSGTNMFNLAFAGVLRSALILVSPLLLHYTDQLLDAYRNADLRYFAGISHPGVRGFQPGNIHSAWDVDLGRLEVELDRWLAEVG